MKPVNVGVLAYINTYPVDWALRFGPLKALVNPVSGTPARLNRLFLDGALDVAPLSSVVAGQHPSVLRGFDGWCIAAPGAVGSVVLASKVPVAHLWGKSIAPTSESATSVKLLEILLEDHWKIDARWANGDAAPPARLAIGNEGLRILQTKTVPYCYDLGAQWKAHTGTGFVFGLWCVRKAFASENKRRCAALSVLFHLSGVLSRLNTAAMAKKASKDVGLSPETIRSYWNGLRYRMDKSLAEGFSFFLKRLGLDPSRVRPWHPPHGSPITGDHHDL